MKKTLCLLLSAIMLVSALPLVALGASTIGLVEIYGLVAPAENAEPNYHITVNDPDYQIDYVVWFDHEKGQDMLPGEKFVAGHDYRVQIYLFAQNNFEFLVDGATHKPAVAVNNNDSPLEDALVYGDAEEIMIQLDYPAFESKLISEVEIAGIDRPIAGKTPDYTGVVIGDGYKIDDEGTGSIEWYDITNGEGASEMPKNEEFVAGHKYRVCVWLRAINGYSFVTDTDVAVKINGLEGEHLNENSVIAYVSYDFEHVCELQKVEQVKATTKKDGVIAHYKCDGCGKFFADENAVEEYKSVSVARIDKVALSSSSVTYNGKVRTPSIIVKDTNGKALISGTDYEVKVPSGRKVPGSYKYVITFKGDYEGTTTLTFKINPKTVDVNTISATQSTSVIKLTWGAVEGATGYRVYQYSPSKKAYVQVASVKGVTTYRKATNFKAGTEYKFKIKAYTKEKDGTVLWATASKEFVTATECKAPSIKSVSSPSKSKATVNWSDVSGETGYQLYYSTKKTTGFKKVASYEANKLTGSKKFSSSASGKTIYFKVRAYKKVNGQTIYSDWSAVKSVKIK